MHTILLTINYSVIHEAFSSLGGHIFIESRPVNIVIEFTRSDIAAGVDDGCIITFKTCVRSIIVYSHC